MTTATATRTARPRKRKQLTPEQEAAAAARKERMAGIIKQLAAMTDEQREELARRLPVTKLTGEPYSVGNACMILLQGGAHATICGSFKDWIKRGRCVRKGQHGFSIWVPIGRREKNQETGEVETVEKRGFVLGTVFDVSQTIELEKKGGN